MALIRGANRRRLAAEHFSDPLRLSNSSTKLVLWRSARRYHPAACQSLAFRPAPRASGARHRDGLLAAEPGVTGRAPVELGRSFRVSGDAACESRSAISLVLLLLVGAGRLREQSVRDAAQNQTLQQQQATLQQQTQSCKAAPARSTATTRSWKRCWPKRGSRARLLEDQLAAVARSARHRHHAIGPVRDEKQLTEKQTEALMASTRRRAGARSRPTTACSATCRPLEPPGHRGSPRWRRGAHRAARRHGFSSRARRSCSRWPARCSTRWPPKSPGAYPDQKIGVEGHTDDDLIRMPAAVTISSFRSRGPRPSISTWSARGKIAGQPDVHRRPRRQPSGGLQRHGGRQGANSRVELVIYPEKVAPPLAAAAEPAGYNRLADRRPNSCPAKCPALACRHAGRVLSTTATRNLFAF